MLTRIAHRGMQEVHGRSGQAQPVHAIWGLFEVRHHANSRVEAPRRIQGAWRSAGLPPLSPSSCFVCGFGLWRQETGGNSHSQPSRLPGLVRGREPPQGAGGGDTGYKLYRAVNSALQGLRPKTKTSSRSKLFWISTTSFFVIRMGQIYSQGVPRSEERLKAGPRWGGQSLNRGVCKVPSLSKF